MAKETYLVEVEVPDGCTAEDVRRYIKAAVQDHCKTYCPGQYDEDGFEEVPADPIFDLDERKVKVRRVKPEALAGSPRAHAADQNNGRHG